MSYLTSIGEFDEVFWKYDDPEWMLFFLSTIVNVIVLLNSLIALTGETFTIIYESQVPKGYQEKVLQMSVLQDGFRYFFWKDYQPNERLFIARQIGDDDPETDSHTNVREEISSLKSEFKALEERLMQFTEQNSKRIVDVLTERMAPGPVRKSTMSKAKFEKIDTINSAGVASPFSRNATKTLPRHSKV